MLDIKAWVDENNKIFYEFYEKPTKSRNLISKESAMPLAKKIDSLSQEVFRRLHNTKEEVKWERKVLILDKFMTELKASGYSHHDRYVILNSGITRYTKLRQKDKDGKRPFYRKQSFQREERKEEKEKKKVTWFQQKENKYSSVFFIPPTPNRNERREIQ